MTCKYKPGTVAELTLEDGAKVRGFRTSEDGWRTASLGDFYYNREVTDVRPLVVLDPDDREAAHRLTGLYEDGVKALAHQCRILDLPNGDVTTMQEALRSLATTSPKPEEPKGLGAVVIDSRGVRWVRTESAKGSVDPWQAALHVAELDRVRSLPYADIDAVCVLSEGVAI